VKFAHDPDDNTFAMELLPDLFGNAVRARRGKRVARNQPQGRGRVR